MRIGLLVAILLGSLSLTAQHVLYRMPVSGADSADYVLASWRTKLHSSLLPLNPTSDTLYFSKLPAQMPGTAGFKTKVLAGAAGGLQGGTQQRALGYGFAGLNVNRMWRNKWLFGAAVMGLAEALPTYLDTLARSTGTMPGWERIETNGDLVIAPYFTGHLGFRINRHFYVEAGHGKHQWGDGYRSLLLSHNAAPYSYLRVETEGWRVKYVNLWAHLREYNLPGFGQVRGKFLAAHALSWNISSEVNIGLHEMVIWQTRDTLSDRGLDLNYLNPIAFYRPIEFAQGSADNVLLGITWRWKASERFTHYGQILIDEMVLAEVRAQNGWWANKYGAQIGFKWFEAFPNTHIQSEINVMRPFTYTHGSVLQNYGHMGQALAHPLGTNFLDWIAIVHFQKDRWDARLLNIWAIYGRDVDDNNYGGNIYRSYRDPLNTYWNKLAQGLKSTFHYTQARIGYMAWPKWDGEVNLTYAFRFEGNQRREATDHLLWLGLTTTRLPFLRDF